MTTPERDPQVKAEARRVVDRLLLDVRDVLTRRAGRDGGWEVPGDLAEFGDVTGLLRVADLTVLAPLAAAVDQARAELAAIESEVEQSKRDRYGPGYRRAG